MASIRVTCGLDFSHVYDISGSLLKARQQGYDFISVSLVHQRFSQECIDQKTEDQRGPLTRSDLLLNSTEWNSLVVGKLNARNTIFCDSDEHSRRANAEKNIQRELSLASHLGLPAIMVTLNSERCVNLARILHNRAIQGPCYQIWVRVPLVSQRETANAFRLDSQKTNSFSEDTWLWWNRFHSISNYQARIAVALELTAELPDSDIIDRWLGEPIRCVIVPTSIFMTNKSAFPVLSKAHQKLIQQLSKIKAQFIISGPLRHQYIKLYQQYLEHIIRNPDSDYQKEFIQGYEDFLQCPLQPLMDNLESQTYEVFEKDPIKYLKYEEAMNAAIKDKHEQLATFDKSDPLIVLMVVGAGRGPLVRSALKAAHQVGASIKVYAIEKNPNAVITLQVQQREVWKEKVTVVSTDMREWEAPEKADILVSELLGSFGDNELSPECLDGAQKFLKDDGISIPQSYTSYITPIQSTKLYNEVRMSREKDKHFAAHFETPYVVFLQNKLELAPSQKLFTFTHPNRAEVIDNQRYKALQFRVDIDAAVHGLAGYFETTLYKDIGLSIRPETHSPGMLSWFPILFPLQTPISINGGDIFELHFWRRANKKNVWYEWCVSSPTVTPIQNPNGRGYMIGL